MESFTLNHLTDVEFEEFCYDLLGELGFINLNWRKGTGLTSSPSDRGRDIECDSEQTDIDGRKRLEKWFVECKHYERGVPPEKIQGAITWASSSNVSTLLIIASNHLSNPAKDYLEDYVKNNNPRFKIKVWERPDLEKLTLDKSRLLRKYQIVGEFPFLNILHPAHILYIRNFPINSLDYLFRVLDELDAEKRDSILDWGYHFIAQPRRTYSTSKILGMEVTVTDKILDEISYEKFREKCYQIAHSGLLDEPLIVFLIINFVLQGNFAISDTTSIDQRMYEHKETEIYFRHRAEKNPHEKDDIERIIATANRLMKDMPERTKRNYELYTYLCQNVISKLFLEELELAR